MNTLDMPVSYAHLLDNSDKVESVLSSDEELEVLMDDIACDWSHEDEDDLLAALGGETVEEALAESGPLLDMSCGHIADELLDLIMESETQQQQTPVAQQPQEELRRACTPPAQLQRGEVLVLPAMSPFPARLVYEHELSAPHPSDDIWLKFDFPEKPDPVVPPLLEYAAKFNADSDFVELGMMEEIVVGEVLEDSRVKQQSDVMWTGANRRGRRARSASEITRVRRRNLFPDTKPQPPQQPVSPSTSDNSLLLANRSTTVPAASALKARPMRSLLNTQQQQRTGEVVIKTNARSILLPTSRPPVVNATATSSPATTRIIVKAAGPITNRRPEASTSKAKVTEPTENRSPRPETPQSIAESEEDEAPVFRHTIDSIFDSAFCDKPISTVYLTPSDSSGSPKSTTFDDDDEDEEDDDDDEDEDYEDEDYAEDSASEVVIKEERPAGTVMSYISDHSYHLSKSSVRTDNLGVQTPSDSEEEIDVVSVAGEKSARLPHNPSARDKRQIQMKVATAIHRNAGPGRPRAGPQQQQQSTTGKKRQAAAPAGQRQVKKAKGAASGRRGRGRARRNYDDEPDSCEKRSLHNNMERQRRIDLRRLVDELRVLVPATADVKRAPKVVILREGAVYCRHLAVENKELRARKSSLRGRQDQLKAYLSSLRRERAAALQVWSTEEEEEQEAAEEIEQIFIKEEPIEIKEEPLDLY